jgi:hypothetical protein
MDSVGLIEQLAIILAGVTAVFVFFLLKLVSERKAIVHALTSSEDRLRALGAARAATRERDQPMRYEPTVEELIASHPDLVLTKEYEEYRLLIGLTPPWLQNKLVLDNPWPWMTRRRKVARWIDYARGSLLMATIGSGVALIGAVIAASRLLLFAAVGTFMMVLGLQILYGAAQDAGLVGTTTTEKPEPTVGGPKVIDEVAESSH